MRVGSEEFAILVSVSNSDELVLLKEKINQAVCDLDM